MSSATSLSLDDLLSLKPIGHSADNKQLTSVGTTHGPFKSRARGHGLDFDDLRLYSPGDDVRHIDWKVSARYQHTFTRLFREERDSTVCFAVDLRQPMFTGTDALRAVTAARLLAALAWRAAARGQRTALFALTDNDIHSELPMSGDASVLRICRTLVQAFDQQTQINESKESSPLSIEALFDALILGGRQLGSTVLITGFDDYFSETHKASLSTGLSLLQAKHERHRHQLTAVQVLDTYENESLPEGRYGYRISSVFGKSTRARSKNVNAAQRASLTNHLKAQQDAIKALCESHFIHCVDHLGPATDHTITDVSTELAAQGVFA